MTTISPAPAPTPAPTAAAAPAPTSTAPPATIPPPSGPQTIEITDFVYSPSPLTIAAGTKVTAHNNDTFTHTWSATDRTWDSGSIPKGASFSFTFTQPGTFAYFCTLHPSMKGSVTVTA